jgi:DNA repair protein RadC
MTKIKNLPKFKRPREKLETQGPKALKDHELLAILLRTGYQGKSALEVAKRILKRYPQNKLANLSFKELAKIKGVGKSRAATIIAAFTLSRRVNLDQKAIKINSPEDAFKVLSFIRNKKREYFVALYLDAENKLIAQKVISIGSLEASIVHPREVFYPAIKHRASAVIIAHNHPSGNLEPSRGDLEITRKIIRAGEVLGIELLDHVIITKESFFSFKERETL